MNFLNDNLRFAMIFALSFVGNALFLNIPLMLFLLCFCSILLFSQKSIIDNQIIVGVLLLSASLLFFFSKNLLEQRIYDPFYFMWPVYVLVFIFFCSKDDLFGSFHPPMLIILFISLFFLWGAMNYEDETGRAYFIFGANVLYRLFLFLSFLQMIHSNNILIKLLFFIIGISGVYLTGSRMGLLLAFLLYTVYFLSPFTSGSFSSKKLSRVFVFLPFLGLILFLNFEALNSVYEILLNSEGMLSRLLMLSGGSISIRLNFLSTFLEHFNFFGTPSYVFDFFFFKEYFPYPHNIISELIFYYGFLGVIFCLIIIIEYIKTFKRFLKRIKISPIEIAFLVIFPSTLASGDIVDGLLVLFYAIPSFLNMCGDSYQQYQSTKKTMGK